MTEQEDFLSMFYEATIDTSKITDEEIKERCLFPFMDGDHFLPSQEEIDLYTAAYRALDGCEILAIKTRIGYSLMDFDDEYEHLFRNYIFEIEKDPIHGTYKKEEREIFMEEWKNGDYIQQEQLFFQANELTNIRKAERTT